VNCVRARASATEFFPSHRWLIDARHRGIILAFYEFVRVADDIADHGDTERG